MKIDVIKIGNKIVLLQGNIPLEVLKKIDRYNPTPSCRLFKVVALDYCYLYTDMIALNATKGTQFRDDFKFVWTTYYPNVYEHLKKQCELFNEHYEKIVAS